MIKKMFMVLSICALIGISGNQVFAEDISTSGNGVSTSDTQYQGNVTSNNGVRTTAVDTSPRRSNWGWVGLLGLAGLAGLRGRNSNPDPERQR